MSLLEPVPDKRLPPPPSNSVRPVLPRSNSAPWQKTDPPEPLVLKKSRASTILTTVAPALRKRHSAYTLSSPQDRPTAPVPDIPTQPPQQPPRSPTREEGRSTPTVPPKSKPKARSRPSTATGTREEITPWEFFPAPASFESDVRSNGSVPTRNRPLPMTGAVEEVTPWELYPVQAETTRSALKTGLVEDVTPWELFPAPPYDDSPKPASIAPKQSLSPPRLSTSSGSAKSFSELAHIRRRKSTTNKAIKSRVNTLPVSSSQSSGQAVASRSGHTSPVVQHSGTIASKSAPTTPQLAHEATAPSSLITFSSSRRQAPFKSSPRSPQQNMKFSTADRTILEELKRNIKVRAAQFVTKGVASGVGNCGKKHHPYPREEVPYPRSYEREVMDLDVWETAFCQDICESLTWHVFETPPTKVLDLGCGTGTWILNCARSWRDCQFVGLDIVPLHPDLQQVGSPDLASRVTWVQSNFLEGLPFPNEEFDFVHIKRIALGVPEDKWDTLLEEIIRVMKPGGAFEMLEEDLFFPGKVIDNGDSDSDSDSEHRSSRRSSAYSEQQDLADDIRVGTKSKDSYKSDDNSPLTPTTSTTTFPETPSRSTSPTQEVKITEQPGRDSEENFYAQTYLDSIVPQPPKAGYTVMIPPHSRSANRPLLHVKTPSGRQQKTGGSAMSLLASPMTSAEPPDRALDTAAEWKAKIRPRGYSLTTTSTLSPASQVASSFQNEPLDSPVEHSSPRNPSSIFSPFLLRPVPKPRVNPRDHTLLETIYTEMLGSRFINIAPLALLTNSLGLYFTDVRTHPPLQHAFPPVQIKPPNHLEEDRASISDSDYSSDPDGARDAILPSPSSRPTRKRRSRRISARSPNNEELQPVGDEKRWLNVRGLIHHSSSYITLDEARIAAFSPSTRTNFSGGKFTAGTPSRGSRLPNTTMHLDLRSLNLHLALRTAEVLACSESMWEWVLGCQAATQVRNMGKGGVRPSRSRSSEFALRGPQSFALSGTSGSSSSLIQNSILELSREDFNRLLSNFEMDMRDKFSLGDALQDRISWFVIASPPSEERAMFDKACKRWDKWERKQRQTSSRPYSLSSKQYQREKSQASFTSDTSADTTPRHPDQQDPGRPGSNHSNNDAAMSPSSRLAGRDADNKPASTYSDGSKVLPPTRQLSRAMRVFVAWKA